MKLLDAIEALNAGKKIHSTRWGKERYIYQRADGYIYDEYNDRYPLLIYLKEFISDSISKANPDTILEIYETQEEVKLNKVIDIIKKARLTACNNRHRCSASMNEALHDIEEMCEELLCEELLKEIEK